MAVTIRDVAREAGVSVATVSHALTGYTDISVKTRQKIQETARRLGYQPNVNGRNLASKKSNRIALIIPDLYSEETIWESVDDFPEAVVLEDQEAGASSINIRYYESELKILEPGPVLSLAEHIKTGYQLKIYNGFLEEPPVKGAPNTCWEYTDYQITLKKGDRVSVLQKTPEGTMVRKRGVTGWYYGKLEDAEK